MANPPLQPVRGTRDLIGEDFRAHHHVISAARRVTALYGYEEWATPIFEATGVFARSLGETSDVVSKEMYSFEDRGGDSITLRPENTAGICRALVSNGLTQSNLPRKVFYAGPMFRYERPQKGRYRQFHQIGAEVLGAAEPLADAEVIAAGWHILVDLGISEGVVLEINTLGDAESRDAYRAALVAHFTAHQDGLSADSQVRLAKNPMRILDSKDEGDRRIVATAPTIEPFLTEKASAFFESVLRHLDTLGVPTRKNPRIVRGLDYYSHTAFEFVTDRLGAQGTVMAGGRYDGLVEEMGGPATPCVGWAAGVERLSMLLDDIPRGPTPVAIIAAEGGSSLAIEIMQALRRGGIACDMAYKGSVKRQFDRANKKKMRFAIVLGGDEIATSTVTMRDLQTGVQERVPAALYPIAEWLVARGGADQQLNP
ncbi:MULTISPECIES: histidine--tRNA ligase [Roseomonadaceae]|uniref:Histidine--tRNA ligase n=1 Tax=Falsiroseomonas oleicola TaxID=2801474 RepID=A0ABS6H2T4_9PROT|nr:histidine--tRNA ligase [Roseomonas oleicola]MBU8542977.1 histidine--tRNA ligase [Roseomonas oleicola]